MYEVADTSGIRDWNQAAIAQTLNAVVRAKLDVIDRIPSNSHTAVFREGVDTTADAIAEAFGLRRAETGN